MEERLERLEETLVSVLPGPVNWTYYGLLVDGILFHAPDVGGPVCMAIQERLERLEETLVSVLPGPVNWTYYGLLVDGILFHAPDVGGPVCMAIQSLIHRWLETILGVLLFSAEAFLCWRRAGVPNDLTPRPHSLPLRKTVILTMAFIYGVEVGYKFATRQMIYLLYPCHLLHLLQLFLLVVPNNSWWACGLFRISLYSVNGPMTALILPVTDTLHLPLEKEWYFVQHYALVLVPFYLLSLGGAYAAEPLGSWAWAFLATALTMLYYLVPMQIVAMYTGINVSMVMCPVEGDPFHGPWWKTVGFFHQHLLIPAFGKLFHLVASRLFTLSPSDEVSVLASADPRPKTQ